MKNKKKIFAVVLAFTMIVCCMPSTGFAETKIKNVKETQTSEFTDMPSNWATTALTNAVKNGLLKGYKKADGLNIKPNGNLNRAEMVAVVNRAFGAIEKTNLNGVTDVKSNSWYAKDIEKAVHMGTMNLDKRMRPKDKITRQEACTILARAFKMETSDSAYSALNTFKDESNISSWAKASMCVLVEKGILSGSSGKLKPKANITRAEFAKIMDNMVKQYINKAGVIIKVAPSGNVMINTPGVTLKKVSVNGDLIIGDGVGSGEVILDSVKVTGKIIVRGGGVHSIIIKGNSSVENVVIAKVDGDVKVAVEGNANVNVIAVNDGKDNVLVEGKVETIQVVTPNVPVVIQNAIITTVNVNAKDSNLTIAHGSTVSNINVASDAKSTKAKVAGSVTNLKNAAPKMELKVTGKVKTVEELKSATASTLDIAKGATVNKLDTDANMKISGEGKPGKITGTGTITKSNGEKISAKSEDSGSLGGGGGSCVGGGGGGQSPVKKDKSVLGTVINGVIIPVKGETPVTIAKETEEYTATVTWDTNPETFAENTVYTATITLTPKSGYTLTGIKENQFTVAGATTVTNSANTGVINAVFPATEKDDKVGFYVTHISYEDKNHLRIGFNEEIDETTAKNVSNYTLGGTFGLTGNPSEVVMENSIYIEAVILTVNDMSTFVEGQTISVTVANVLDKEGNKIDAEHDTVVYGSPVNLEYVDATHLRVSFFNKNIDKISAENVVNYTLGGTFGLIGNPIKAVLGGNDNNEVTLTVSDMSLIEFDGDISISVTNVLDSEGNTINGNNKIYADNIEPKLVKLKPIDSTHLALQFNEKMDETSVKNVSNYTLGGTFGLTGNPSEAKTENSIYTEIVILTVNDMSTFVEGQTITVTVTNVLDEKGNLVDAENNTAEYVKK